MITNGPKIKYVDFIFENCDAARVHKSDILMMELIHVVPSLYLGLDDFTKRYECEHFIMRFSDLPNIKYLDFSDSITSLYQRLKKHNDISYISLILDNGKNVDIRVPWDGTITENNLQKLYQDENDKRYTLQITEHKK